MEDKGLIKTAYLCFLTSLSECLGLNGMINELARMWKEEVVAKFETLSWNLPGETEENRVNT